MSYAMQNLAAARKMHRRFKMTCIVPNCQGVLCGRPAIKSHSIQHNGILSRLSEKGKVDCLGENTKNESVFVYALKDVGVSGEASVFKCLCSEHDKKLFSDIEDCAFLCEDKQYFEYALKAVLYSYWDKCNAAAMNFFDEKTMHHVNPFCSFVLNHFEKQVLDDREAYYNELIRFWEIMKNEQYGDLLSWRFIISKEVNCAVSTSINVYRKFNGSPFGTENSRYPLLHISLFPSDGKSYLLISCLRENEEYFKVFTSQLVMLSEDSILKRFNVLLPLLSDNIMISPRVVDKMSEKERYELLTVFNCKTSSCYLNNTVSIDALSTQVSYNIF